MSGAKLVWARTGQVVTRQWICQQHPELMIEENLSKDGLMAINTKSTEFDFYDTLEQAKAGAPSLLNP